MRPVRLDKHQFGLIHSVWIAPPLEHDLSTIVRKTRLLRPDAGRESSGRAFARVVHEHRTESAAVCLEQSKAAIRIRGCNRINWNLASIGAVHVDHERARLFSMAHLDDANFSIACPVGSHYIPALERQSTRRAAGIGEYEKDSTTRTHARREYPALVGRPARIMVHELWCLHGVPLSVCRSRQHSKQHQSWQR